MYIKLGNMLLDMPEDLVKEAISLKKLGIEGYAWKKELAIEFVNYLCKKGYAILGGDVYRKNNEKIVSTADSWYINRISHDSWHKYVKDSSTYSLKYILDYYKNNGGDFYYSFVFSDELHM